MTRQQYQGPPPGSPESVAGLRKRLGRKAAVCERCGGDGVETYDGMPCPCGDCDGTGERRIPCEYCERSGHVEAGPPGATYSAPCPRCHGRGYNGQKPESRS